MKSPFEKLKKFGLHKSEPRENWDNPILVHVDGLTQAAKDMKDMRTCYDSLLSAAAATANSAYEFSESLLEMGNWLLEKTTMDDDGETGGALSMLGQVQLDLQKLVDSYRSQIIMTITNPSESLLSELRKVEELKLQCDEKREMLEYMAEQFKEKGKSRHGKGENFTLQQLQVVREEYDEVASFCIFRVESLKQGKSWSLLTQAARHHAAQLNFFRKGLQSLEAVESHIKNVAKKQHIDYELCELNEGDEGNRVESNDDGELSFDHGHDKLELDNAYPSRNSVEMDQLGTQSAQTSTVKDIEVQIAISKNLGEQMLGQQRPAGSHSAPIYAEKLDPSDRIREMRTAMRAINSHALPTPADAKGPITSTCTPLSSSMLLWHSSPLEIGKQKKFIYDHLSAPRSSKSQVALENSNAKHFLPLPPAATQFDAQSGFETRKITRQAFSGPLASKPSFTKQQCPISGPISSAELPQSSSGLLSRVAGSQAPSALNVANNTSPPPVGTPKISELHELPRPPSQPMRSGGALGHSAPLVNRNQEVCLINRNALGQSKEGSRLPLPQLTVSRSFSIPSSSQRAIAVHSGKLLASSQIVQKTGVASPLLTPISLSKMKSPNPEQIRDRMNSVAVAVSSA